LQLIVEGFAVGEDHADLVDRPLYHLDVLGFLPFHNQGHANDLGGGRYIEDEGLVRLQRGQDRWLGDERIELVECLWYLLHPAERVRPLQQFITRKPAFP
jgi:hypothetical protein